MLYLDGATQGPLEPRERVTFYWMTGRLDWEDLTEEVTFFFF